jgi:hypothetical protein
MLLPAQTGLLLPATGAVGAAGSTRVIGPTFSDVQLEAETFMAVYVPALRPFITIIPAPEEVNAKGVAGILFFK